MNKPKADCSNLKHILRYPEDQRPKKVTVQQLPPFIDQDSKSTTESKVSEQIKPHIDLSAPTLNSTLCVKKRVKKVEETKISKIKDVKKLPSPERRSIDEKITKQMNFPFDKKLYKELISLKLRDKPVLQQTTTAHEPAMRDKVPKLENFYTPPANFEYSIPVSSSLGNHTTSKQYDGLRLHKVMRTWKDNRPD